MMALVPRMVALRPALGAIHAVPARGFSRKATRKALTGKMGNKHYYKGKRGRPTGRHTKHGGYILDAPKYPHARRAEDDWKYLRGRLESHPAYSFSDERLPTVSQQAFELSRLIIVSYRRFLGLPKNPGKSAPTQGSAPLEPMPEGASELAYAARRGKFSQVEALLQDSEQAVDVGAKDAHGRTALHYAAMYGHRDVVAKLLDEGADDCEDNDGTLAVTLAALSCRPQSLGVVTELLGMEDGIFPLTRTPQGFGIELDRRGVITGYTGDGRPAEAANLPLGAVVTAVDGKAVLGKHAVIDAIRGAQKVAKASGSSGAEPTVEFTLMTPRGLVEEKEDELLTKMEGKPQAREDVNELRARIETGVEAALEIPESQVITAINRIWPDKHFKTDEEGNIIGEGGTWRAPEYVVPDLEGFQLKAYVTRSKKTNID